MDQQVSFREYEFEKEKVLALSQAFFNCLVPSGSNEQDALLEALQQVVTEEIADEIYGLPPLLEQGERTHLRDDIPAYILSTDHGHQLHFDAPTDPVAATQLFINYLTDHPEMIVRGFSSKVTHSALQRLYKQLVTVSFHTTFVPLFNKPESFDPLISMGTIISPTLDSNTGNIHFKVLDEDSSIIETVVTPKDLISELLRAIYPYSLHSILERGSIMKALARLSMTFQRVKTKEA